MSAQPQAASQYGDPADTARKALSRLQAEFAQRGYALDQFGDGTLIVRRWGLCKSLANMAEAERWLQRIGGSE